MMELDMVDGVAKSATWGGTGGSEIITVFALFPTNFSTSVAQAFHLEMRIEMDFSCFLFLRKYHFEMECTGIQKKNVWLFLYES